MKITDRCVYGIGETIYDIIFKEGKPVTGHPGGSTYNCMISLGRCGIKGAFISETGKDMIGDMIINFLEQNNISGKYVNQFDGGKSALALAFLNNNNDAVYNFYKDYPKQRLQLEPPDFEMKDILVFGSFFALNQTIRMQVKTIIEEAFRKGSFIYYDPNYRSTHAENRHELIQTLIENYQLSTIVRGSDEDFANIYPGKGLEEIYHEISPYCPYFICTANKNEITVFTPVYHIQIPVTQIETVSTIGAGDSFNAGFIHGIIKNNILKDDVPNLSRDVWINLVKSGIMFSTEVCKRYENFVPEGFATLL